MATHNDVRKKGYAEAAEYQLILLSRNWGTALKGRALKKLRPIVAWGSIDPTKYLSSRCVLYI